MEENIQNSTDNIMIDTKAVVLALKKVYKERKLSQDKAYEIVREHDPSAAVSRSTIARVFREGSEDQGFRWETTLKPIANALLNVEDLENDTPDTQAFKSILKLKSDIIDELGEKMKDYDKLQEQILYYKDTIKLLNEQIAYKDSRIDKLLDTNERQSITNERLTEQLINCHSCPKEK